MYDLLLSGGRIIDGSGSPAYEGSVAVKDGRIVAVGSVGTKESVETVDVKGACISAGFIDAHAHDDLAVLNHPDHAPKLLQGVTTVALGNCGYGCAPVGGDYDAVRKYSEPVIGRFAGRWDWKCFDEYVERLVHMPTTVNTVAQIPHGMVRAAVMGFEARAATNEEIEAMTTLVDEAMSAGAIGLSFGLMYAPGCYADQVELIALAREVARHGGILTCHLRSEGGALREAMEEFFYLGRVTGVSLHVSHLKSISRPNHGRIPAILTWLDELRARGEDITCDVYPYPASSTIITSLMPQWSLNGGLQAMLRRLKDSVVRERIKADFTKPWGRVENRLLGTGYARIHVCGLQHPSNTMFEGKSLKQIAEIKGIVPDECLLQLMEEEEGQANIILFQMAESDVQAALGWSWAMIGSDGLPLDSDFIHPRHYGTFPRILGHYVREQRLFSLEEAVRKMTALPAQRFHLPHRGRILPGFIADLVVFSPTVIQDKATFESPRQFPEGIGLVVVNGKIAARSGKLTGNRPGQHLFQSFA